MRWLVIVLVCLFFVWFSLSGSQQGYEVELTEDVEIIAIRPVRSNTGRLNFYVSFRLEDGRVDTMSLPNVNSFEVGRIIRVDVLAKPGKKNRYRLAEDAVRP